MNGFTGQLSGYFEMDGASGRILPDALFGQKDSVRFSTVLPAAFFTVTWRKPGRPEKSLTRPAGSFLVTVFFPWRITWVATTGSL